MNVDDSRMCQWISIRGDADVLHMLIEHSVNMFQNMLLYNRQIQCAIIMICLLLVLSVRQAMAKNFFLINNDFLGAGVSSGICRSNGYWLVMLAASGMHQETIET